MNEPTRDDEGRVVGVLHRVEDITAVTEFLGDPHRAAARELDAGRALRAYAWAIAELKDATADLRGQNKLLVNSLLAVGDSRLPVTTENARRGWIRKRLAEATPRLPGARSSRGLRWIDGAIAD